MKIGNYDVFLLDAGRFRLDGGAMFGVVPRALWQKHKFPDDKNRIDMSTNLLLICDTQRRILVDTGLGNKHDDKFGRIYGIDHSQHSLDKALAAHGLSSQDITDVILTHLHFDHAGGATRRTAAGALLPTFANATYYIQSRHYEWALSKSEKDRASFLTENIVPLKDSGQLKMLNGEQMLFKGIELRIVDGHTVGQQMVLIHDAQQPLLYAADLLPTAAHISIPWVMAYDLFPLATIEEKRHYLLQASNNHWRVIFEHDPEIPCSTITRTESGYAIDQVCDLD